MGDFVTVTSAATTRSPGSGRSWTVRDSLPVSLQLMVYAQVLALAVAVPAGVLTAYRAGSRGDRIANATAFGMLAVPNFALASCSPTTSASSWGGCRSAATSGPARTSSSTSGA